MVREERSPAGDAGRRGDPLTAGVDFGSDGIDFRKATGAFQLHLIAHAMALTKGNKNKAAALLGLKRTTLLEMLKRKPLDRRELSEA